MSERMTKRVILTNKETGQVLPEAALIQVDPISIVVRFDKSSTHNVFERADWVAEYIWSCRRRTSEYF